MRHRARARCPQLPDAGCSSPACRPVERSTTRRFALALIRARDPTRGISHVAVKIRLMRVGKKKQPTYRVVVADGRSPRDGRFIEIIGQYAPREEPSRVADRRRARPRLAAQGRPADRAGAEAARPRPACGRSTSPSAASTVDAKLARRGLADTAAPSAKAVEEGRRPRRRRPRPPAGRRHRPRPRPTGRGSAGRHEAAARPRRAAEAPAAEASRRAERPMADDDRRRRRGRPTIDDNVDDVDDDDFDDEDEVGAEGNRIVGARAKAVVEHVTRNLADDPDAVEVEVERARRRGHAARAREPERHGPPHRQARPRDPGAAPGRAGRRRAPRASRPPSTSSSSTPMAPRSRLEVGRIGRAHGLRGEVTVDAHHATGRSAPRRARCCYAGDRELVDRRVAPAPGTAGSCASTGRRPRRRPRRCAGIAAHRRSAAPTRRRRRALGARADRRRGARPARARRSARVRRGRGEPGARPARARRRRARPDGVRRRAATTAWSSSTRPTGCST